MTKGTDVLLGMQLLIIRYTYLLSGKEFLESNSKVESSRISLKKSLNKLSEFKEELQLHLGALGNENNNFNLENLKEFIAEKHFPNLPGNAVGSMVTKSLESQMQTLLQCYQQILRMGSLSIGTESVMLRHLSEIQSATCNLIKSKHYSNIEHAETRELSYA